MKLKEKIVLSFIALLMLSQVVVSKFQVWRFSPYLEDSFTFAHEKCRVELLGEVKSPGVYLIAPGTVLRKVLKKKILTKQSDLQSMDLDVYIEKDQQIIVPRKEIEDSRGKKKRVKRISSLSL